MPRSSVRFRISVILPHEKGVLTESVFSNPNRLDWHPHGCPKESLPFTVKAAPTHRVGFRTPFRTQRKGCMSRKARQERVVGVSCRELPPPTSRLSFGSRGCARSYRTSLTVIPLLRYRCASGCPCRQGGRSCSPKAGKSGPVKESPEYRRCEKEPRQLTPTTKLPTTNQPTSRVRRRRRQTGRRAAQLNCRRPPALAVGGARFAAHRLIVTNPKRERHRRR
jgi:hypothetical protein